MAEARPASVWCSPSAARNQRHPSVVSTVGGRDRCRHHFQPRVATGAKPSWSGDQLRRPPRPDQDAAALPRNRPARHDRCHSRQKAPARVEGQPAEVRGQTDRQLSRSITPDLVYVRRCRQQNGRPRQHSARHCRHRPPRAARPRRGRRRVICDRCPAHQRAEPRVGGPHDLPDGGSDREALPDLMKVQRRSFTGPYVSGASDYVLVLFVFGEKSQCPIP